MPVGVIMAVVVVVRIITRVVAVSDAGEQGA